MSDGAALPKDLDLALEIQFSSQKKAHFSCFLCRFSASIFFPFSKHKKMKPFKAIFFFPHFDFILLHRMLLNDSADWSKGEINVIY